MFVNPPRCTIDMETRSTCSLRNSGSWRYSLDSTTEVLCIAYRLPTWEPGRTGLWTPYDDSWDTLTELVDWVLAGRLVEAHNAWFERGIWANIMVPRFCWPTVPSSSWRCSAAKSAAHALPRALGDCAKALGLSEQKIRGGMDVDTGAKKLQKMYKPRKPRKAEREAWAKTKAGLAGKPHPIVYWESVDLSRQLYDYCRQDVLAEEAISKRLDDLSPSETEVYLLDQTINGRGFQLDLDAIRTAERLISRETVRLNGELQQLTGGVVAKATQRAQMLKWFASEGLNLADTQKETIEHALADQYYSDAARRGLELVRTLGRSSTAKYRKMADWACPDGRVRGGLLYHGASTGRWSGAGVQPHNFPKGRPGGPGKDQEALWSSLKAGKLDKYPDVMEALSEGLRGAIVAAPGKQLYVADYASIEARVLLWLADDKEALGVFKRGEDIYCEMASEIYGRPITKTDTDERQLGKVTILACGYQMGAAKFQDTAATYGINIDEDWAKRTVDAYRSKFWRVKQLWDEQQATAIEACYVPQETVTTKYVSWLYDDDEGFLFCMLPSGRRLAYPEPEIHLKQTPWGEKRPALTFMGINPIVKRWERQHTYGGSIVENITQAVSRDIMAAAMVRCEQSGVYEVVLTVHDEIVAEADLGSGSVCAFESLLTELPLWAKGCPIAAEGWRGLRYHK